MKTKNKIKRTLKHPYTIITITILLVLTTIILVTYPHIKLKGTNPTRVTYPNSYEEQGVTTPKYQKNLLSKVKIKNNIDETKLGEEVFLIFGGGYALFFVRVWIGYPSGICSF